MGIDVTENNQVLYNGSHSKGLCSSLANNPKHFRLGTLDVLSVFSRNVRGMNKGDGNPFIYSLKGLNNYTITNGELKHFRPEFYSLLNKVYQIIGSIDHLVVPPSSSKIAYFLARRMSAISGAELHDGLLVKRKVSDYLDMDVEQVAKRHRKAVNKLLDAWKKVPNSTMSLKRIPTPVRHYFPVLKAADPVAISSLSGNIVLVDDLLATGSTLLSAQEQLNQFGLSVTTAICLLGQLDK